MKSKKKKKKINPTSTELFYIIILIVLMEFQLIFIADKIIQTNKEQNQVINNLQKINTYYNIRQENINAMGEYYPTEKSIVLYTNNYSKEQIINTFFHELGHWQWYEKLTETQKNDYKTMFSNATNFVSEYAETSFEEDYAENHALTYSCNTSKDNLPIDRQKYFN